MIKNLAWSLSVAWVLLVGIEQLAVAQCDTAAPQLTAFSFSPNSVNTTASAQNVTCNMTLQDSPAGVFGASCSFQFIDFLSGAVQTQSCAATSGVGNVYSCTVTLPRYAAAGVWKAFVAAFDSVGNQRGWTDIDLLLLGFPTDLSVSSDSDLIAPNITALSFTPNSVDVSAQARTVTCTMTMTDAKSGVDTARCFFEAPGVGLQNAGCSSNTLKSGTRQNGVFECQLSIPRYSDQGTWTISTSAIDFTGNSISFDTATLAGLGFATNLNVISVPEDIVPPVQTSFDFNPKSANAASNATPITCDFGYTDSPAGLQGASCTFNFTDFLVNPPVVQSIGCTANTPTSGTPQAGTTRCTVSLPRYSAPGAWIASVNYVDLVGNSGGGPPVATPLNVTCSGDPEPSIQFSNKTTLSWGPIPGATRYNVYRGNVANLSSTYGTCQNSRDPNLTDTQFVESQVPSPAGSGFHFLVSYTSGGVEKGLGNRSSGAPRTVSPPCP